MKSANLVVALLCLAGCGTAEPPPQAETQTNKVATSGKEPAALASVPKEVLDAARAAQPTMTVTGAEAETRDGRSYYDVAGRLPDGSEVELDLLLKPDGWSVVETQRDIPFGSVPEAVRAASAKADPDFAPARVIESRQADGLIVYELFGPPQKGGEARKVEIKFDGRAAELLTKEWAH